MATCRHCGRKAGWFSEVHEQCAGIARKGYTLLTSAIAAAVAADKPFAEVRSTLEQISDDHKIHPDEMRQAIIEAWAKAAEQIGLSEPINMQRHSTMTNFYEHAGITGQELVGTDGFKTATCSLMLWFMLTGKPMSCEHPHPFNLAQDEIPLIFFGSTVYSQKIGIRTYEREKPGPSNQVGHGHYYPYNEFMVERADTAMMKEIDYGGMLLTTNNLYFGGEYKTFRVPYSSIIRSRPFVNGLAIFRDISHECEVFTVVNAWPACGWFLFNATHFLAQPEARALYASRGEPVFSDRPARTTNSTSPPSQIKQWDVFISHASEDKNELVRPLAEALRNADISVWYDEFSLKLGDSLRESIDLGLANSRYGIVVLSKSFFAKHWPTQELNGLATREIKGNKTILPIWHNVTFEDVRTFSPILADRIAENSTSGLDKLVQRIIEVLIPGK